MARLLDRRRDPADRGYAALSIAALLLFGSAPTGSAGAQGRKASTVAGELSPEIEFRSILRGDGRTRLSQHRGRPVLLALYGDLFGGLEGARGALKLHAEHGDDGLVVLW